MKMALAGMLAVALLASSASAMVLAGARQSTSTPVERVVNLLKDMQQKLEMDEKVEQQVYDKYACWCEKTTSRKAAAIDDATADLRALGQSILKLKGKVATLAAEIEQLTAQIKDNNEAQAQATSIRQRENADYMAETTELKQAIAALEKAVTVLVKGSGTSSLLQSSTRARVKDVISSIPLSRSLKPDQAAVLGEFMQSGSRYAPQSATVQGILKDMYQTFSNDLESSTQTEASKNRQFEDFIATKAEELRNMEAEKASKEQEKAESEETLANTQQVYDDTAAQKAADIEFFDATKKACQAKHEQWTERSSLREEEIAGISEALKILTSDDARELFASAIKAGKETGASNKYDTGRDISPSFLQLEGAPVDRAFAALKDGARKGHSFRLGMLALKLRSAKVGHFEKVLMSIDGMINKLKDENAADIAKRDQCKDEYNSIESTVKDLNWKIEKNVAKIDKLTNLIQLDEAEKEKTIQQIQEVNDHMAAITKEREEENTLFLKSKLEDQQAIDLLMQAREAMSKFYKKNGVDMGPIQGSVKGVFAQEDPEFAISADQAPDAVFSHKGKRKGESKDIVSILTMIIEDLDDEIKNGMKSEEESQLDYEGQMSAATKLRSELTAKKTSLEGSIAQRTQARSDEEEDKTANEGSLDDEVKYRESITPDCDWIIGAFEKRAAARTAEMNGLVGAKDFLVGASKSSAEALLETHKAHAFDDTALSKVGFLGLRQ